MSDARRSKMRSFRSARAFARSLGLSSLREWLDWASTDARPSDIPFDPSQIYAKRGWAGYGDWLGTGTVATKDREYLSFTDARSFVHTLGLRNSDQWRDYVRSGALPDNIPHTPEEVYKGRWRGMGDWLGTGNVSNAKRTFLPFEDARAVVRKLGFKNQRQYFAWKTRPNNIPAAPHKAYAESGWLGYADFIGSET